MKERRITVSRPWEDEQSHRKEYEKQGSDTAFAAKFLEIVREIYGEDFNFSVCCIERGGDCDVVTFGRYPQRVEFCD